MSIETRSPRRGRFAPSPTGPLHFGSLVAATASYLDAKSGGEWLLRIEDLDLARNVAGAADSILHDLEALGFEWDGPVTWQTQRGDLYRAALEHLRGQGRLFGCACTRREIADSALGADGARVYPGTCRDGLPPGRSARAFRLRVESEHIGFVDRLLGPVSQHLAQSVGDFVLLRADGQVAYQLAVVADDADQGVTDVVRGADLVDSTPRQILLQRLLGLPTPTYLHLPVAVDAAGEKLSKQTRAHPIDTGRPQSAVCAALAFLGHAPPFQPETITLAEIWSWALAHWDPALIPATRRRPAAVTAP
ncbi:MAG: tRNA glutamyl-Q(34) synthetase GluQRS [Rhodocyclaceae bacterium]